MYFLMYFTKNMWGVFFPAFAVHCGHIIANRIKRHSRRPFQSSKHNKYV